jgi:hypothetical protein
MRILTGGSIAIMCPARQHGRWARWGPRSQPKHECSFESLCTKRVLRIVGSTDRHLIQLFHPGINTRSGGLGRLPPRRCARHRVHTCTKALERLKNAVENFAGARLAHPAKPLSLGLALFKLSTKNHT